MKKTLSILLIISYLVWGDGVTFSGKSRVESFYTNNVNYGYQQDSKYLRWNFYGNLDLYKLPFRLNLYLTTENYRQNLNQYSLSLNIYKLKQQIPWLSSIGRFNLGTASPNYSILTLNRMRIKGVDFVWSPGIWHFAITGGQMNTSNFQFRQKTGDMSRILQNYQAGVGEPEKSHFYLSFMHVRDQGDSAIVPRQENMILAEDGQICLWDDKVRIKAESAVSLHTRNLSSSKIANEELPSQLPDFISLRVSSSVDWAANFETEIKHKNTKIQGNVKRIGPGYVTLGNPMLFRDRMEYKGKIKQRFMNRKAYISISGRHSYDNLIPWKPADTKITSWGIRTGAFIKGKTNVMINYAPHLIARKYNGTNTNKTSLLSILLGHSFNMIKLTNNSRLYLALQKADSDFKYSNFESRTISFSHRVRMPGSLSFNTSITYNVLERGGENYNRWDYSLYSSYLLKNNFRQQAGWQYKNHAQNGKQIGFFVESNWRFWKFGDMALKLEQNYYRDQIYYKRQDFDQLKLTFRLDKKI